MIDFNSLPPEQQAELEQHIPDIRAAVQPDGSLNLAQFAKSVAVDIQITRADGTVEPAYTAAYSTRNPLERAKYWFTNDVLKKKKLFGVKG